MTLDQFRHSVVTEINSTPRPLPPLVDTTAPQYRRPTVRALARLGSLETFREATLAQVRQRLQTERLRLFCLGNVPTRRGFPGTTISTDASQIIAEQAT